MNITLMNMARSMMFFKNEKLMFWCDAVVSATYLRNRIPSHAIEYKTPHEMWFGHLALVRHLNVFGSTCYALYQRSKETNLVLEVEDVFSWGIQTLPRLTVFMMR